MWSPVLSKDRLLASRVLEYLLGTRVRAHFDAEGEITDADAMSDAIMRRHTPTNQTADLLISVDLLSHFYYETILTENASWLPKTQKAETSML